MNKLCILFAVVVAFAYAKEEPFSIGLGVLSPSYSQTVGKENVKVNVEQKDNGQFSFSVGDPKSGSNTYLNWGGSAASQPINPSGFADANPSGYAGPSSASYGGSGLGSSSGYTGSEGGSSGYAGSGLGSSSGYAGSGLGSSGYTGSGLGSSGYTGSAGLGSSGYTGSAGLGSSGYTGSGLGSSSGYAAPQANPPAYTGYAGYQPPSYGGSSGVGASGFGSENAYGGSSGFGAGNSYGGSSAFGGHYSGQAAAPISPSGYVSESARKPEENPAQILPAGFSYHGTDGQAFLRQGNSPNFVISNENQESARGPAEQSFYDNFKASAAQGSGKVLVNGLVGYGPGGPRGNAPAGGQAGHQFSGFAREHGGHA